MSNLTLKEILHKLDPRVSISKLEQNVLVGNVLGSGFVLGSRIVYEFDMIPPPLRNPLRKTMRLYVGDRIAHGFELTTGFTVGYFVASKFTQKELLRVLSGMTTALGLNFADSIAEYIIENKEMFELTLQGLTQFNDKVDFLIDLGYGASVALPFITAFYIGKKVYNNRLEQNIQENANKILNNIQTEENYGKHIEKMEILVQKRYGGNIQEGDVGYSAIEFIELVKQPFEEIKKDDIKIIYQTLFNQEAPNF
jgi:hypothetical protein